MADCVHTLDATHPLELVDAAASGLAIVLIALVASNRGWVLLGVRHLIKKQQKKCAGVL